MAVVKRFMILTFLVLFSCVSLCSCATRERFHKWKAESEYVPYVSVSKVGIDDTKNVYLREKLDEKYDIKEVFVIYNSRIYFVCSTHETNDFEKDKYIWNIVSMDINNTDDIEFCYSGEFGDVNDYYSLYNLVHSGNYEDKSGFYYDGKIILKDESRLVEYDIESEEVTEYNPEDYKYPQNDYHYTVQEDYQSILLTNSESGYEKLITIDDMADSTYGEDLLKLREETILGGKYLKTDRFFHNVQFIDDELYLICEALNYKGEAYALIFKYDIKNDKYEYVESCFLWDILNYKFYLIEKVETQ